MRHSQAEKMEVIRLVEESALSIRRTLEEFGIARSTFYSWYHRYCEDGYDGLADRKPEPRKFWNRIPQTVKNQVAGAVHPFRGGIGRYPRIPENADNSKKID